MSYPAISLSTATADRHRRPQKRLRPPANLPSTRIRARIIAPATPSPLFRCPHALHPGPSVDSDLAYQQNLAGYSAEVTIEGLKETRTIKSLGQIRKPTGLHPDDVIAEWENILSINYWPIFKIAQQLLVTIPPTTATKLLPIMSDTANAIQETARQNDVAGSVFQKLITDRQTLATYYTRPESTTLAAYLAVPTTSTGLTQKP